MNVKSLHPWNVSYADAVKLQRELAERVIQQSSLTLDSIRLVAGADVSYSRATNRCYCAVVVLSFPRLELVCQKSAITDAAFPYIPGLLSFREIPGLVRAFERLDTIPDVVIADGQGLAHPRRLGLACHLGLVLDMPTVGCAKSRLVGEFEQPGQKKGSSTDLMHRKELVGAVLRTRTNISPVFVSIGHKIGLQTAIKLVLACSPKFRLPETTRAAHNTVINMMRDNETVDSKHINAKEAKFQK
ncbi:MAG TPA: deoxyribonuclease V [bacterium]|nr:deoxyribonuclease V [bacterium]